MQSKKLVRLNNKVYHPDICDHRDYTVILDTDENIPKYVDFRRYCPHVKSDLGIRSSLTHTILSAFETMVNIELHELVPYQKRKKFNYVNEFIKTNNHDFDSEYKLYNNIIKPENKNDITFRQILKMLYNNPYEICTTGVIKYHKVYHILEYAKISCSGTHKGSMNNTIGIKNNIVKTMKYILSQRVPIIGAVKFPYKAYVSKNGILEEGERLDFDYGVLFIGYIDNFKGSNNGYFIFQNSWNRHWGDNGYGYISYKEMIKRKCLDLWIITKLKCENTDLLNYKNINVDCNLKIHIPNKKKSDNNTDLE